MGINLINSFYLKKKKITHLGLMHKVLPILSTQSYNFNSEENKGEIRILFKPTVTRKMLLGVCGLRYFQLEEGCANERRLEKSIGAGQSPTCGLLRPVK